MPEVELFKFILTNVGPYAAVIFFFIWRDWKREDRLAKRLDERDMFIREALTEITKSYHEVSIEVLHHIKDMTRSVEKCAYRTQGERHE